MRNKTILFVLIIAALLRLVGLQNNPPSLFGDELDVGYHAYSILKTGKDYHGNFMPLHFHSFAEWRTPLYLYSAVPTVAIFGITPLGVRLPASFYGIVGVLAVYLLVKEVNSQSNLKITRFRLEEIVAFLLAISPWHIQYSRGAFEVTQMLFLLLMGLYLFLRSLRTKNYLWLSVLCLLLMPWSYSTAKFFIPLLGLAMMIVWHKEIFSFSKLEIIKVIIVGLLLGLPLIYVTFTGEAAQRFGYVGVFTNPTIEHEVGNDRELDAFARGDMKVGLQPSLFDRAFHNKYALWYKNIRDNIATSLSFDFLFAHGDPNPRHSPVGVGQFYFIEAVALVFGTIFFFSEFKNKKLRLFVALWVVFAILPSAITRDGGNHATRLILLLPPLLIIISYGMFKFNKPALLIYLGILLINFISYQHQYWVHYPIESERWWHYGWQQAISYIKENEGEYEKIMISVKDEPPLIFFAANYQYPPEEWQAHSPAYNTTTNLEGFDKVNYIGKFYFATPNASNIYELGKMLDKNTLYLASQKEVLVNLIMEPERTPGDLNLLKSIAFPSGEPAFYLFSKK